MSTQLVGEEQISAFRARSRKQAIDGIMDLIRVRFMERRGRAPTNVQVHELERDIEKFLDAFVEVLT